MSILSSVVAMRDVLMSNNVPPMADGSYALIGSRAALAQVVVASAGKRLTKRRFRRAAGRLKAA